MHFHLFDALQKVIKKLVFFILHQLDVINKKKNNLHMNELLEKEIIKKFVILTQRGTN
jgi:hypothetical protein